MCIIIIYHRGIVQLVARVLWEDLVPVRVWVPRQADSILINIINTIISWLKNFCGVKNNNIRLTLHAYPDNNINKCVRYWSEQTGIPKSQFCKTQIDRRIKKNRKRRLLPYGTIKLVVKTNGDPNLGVFLHRKIMGYIESTGDQIANMRE